MDWKIHASRRLNNSSAPASSRARACGLPKLPLPLIRQGARRDEHLYSV